MGLTIGMRYIEGGKSTRAVIINEIRGRIAYPSGMTKFKTNKRLRRGWCHRVQDKQAYHMLGIKLEMRDRKSTRLNSSHSDLSRMPSSA